MRYLRLAAPRFRTRLICRLRRKSFSYDPLQDYLHVHRIVLQERRRRDNRQIVVVVEQTFGQGLEPKVAFLDRRVPQLVPVGVLDSAEVRVDVSTVGGLLVLRQDVVEILGPLEEAETAGVDVSEIQDGQDPLRILDQGEDLVEAADDLLAPARLDAEPGLDLP